MRIPTLSKVPYTSLRYQLAPTKPPLNHYINRRVYSNMAEHNHSAACCRIPPIQSKDYKEKGKYETIGGLKTCGFCPIVIIIINSLNILRCHRSTHSSKGASLHFRYLWLLSSVASRSWYPFNLWFSRSVSSLHAWFFWRLASWLFLVSIIFQEIYRCRA